MSFFDKNIKLPKLNFDINFSDFTIIESEDNKYILCQIRNKNIILTPEEWVRQCVVKDLIDNKFYDKNMISLEMPIQINNMRKRADVVVFSKEGNPIVLIECKSFKLKLNRQTFDQVARYNAVVRAKYLVLTNGIENIYATMDFEKKKYNFIKKIPNNVKR